MLIFDSFPDKQKAKEFLVTSLQKFGYIGAGVVFDNWEDFDLFYAYPFELTFPVAVVFERSWEEQRNLAKSFGGRFAGI
jgi:hypothetical protein